MSGRTDHYASFKDPSAKVFYLQNDAEHIYRSLSVPYQSHYQFLLSSGLAETLFKKKWIVQFEEVSLPASPGEAIVLKSKKIPFVTYPYEWTFNQWKDAALLTLKIQFQALKAGMTLKDASPFNIVFDGNRPVFVDISSFEVFQPGKPWQAFKQFSENFYLPLLLSRYFDKLGNELYLNNLNGISLEKGLQLLPARAFLNLDTNLFLTLPGKIRKQASQQQSSKPTGNFTKQRSMDFAEQLFRAISRINQGRKVTKWNAYYERDIDRDYLSEKEKLVAEWAGNRFRQDTVVDFGCNTGNFSRLLAPKVKAVISFDEDARSADELYQSCKTGNFPNIFCLVSNLAQPTPAVGWNNLERESLLSRLHADLGIALALIHHLAFSSHIRFDMMADFFTATCKELFIEFIPMEDPKVQLLLAGREESFADYTFSNFIAAFSKTYQVEKEHSFANRRILLHLIRKNNEQ